MRRIGLVPAALALAALFSRQDAYPQSAAAKPKSSPVPNISSCQAPSDVPSGLPPDLYGQIPFFDDYSWRAFAALICDAQAGQRGVPDAAKGRDGAGPRVFETFKSAWEVYHAGAVSSTWNAYADQPANPCPNAPEGQLVLASTSKFIDVMQSGDRGVKLAPLPAQNATYARYLTQYNRISFEYVVPTLTGTTPSIRFPHGSVNIKSAWVEMKGLNADRFYTREAWIPRGAGACQKTAVGLVALHIVQKTPSRPHWIWSTFEQVDNAPDAGVCPTPGGPYTFNNGDCHKAMPLQPPPGNVPDAPPQHVFNVQRTAYLINVKTDDTNRRYQALFSAKSKWKYYELVMTQWPTSDVPPAQAGDPTYTFPTTSTSSAFANTAMETFFQTDRRFSCLGCHAEVGADYDFVWSRYLEPPSSRGQALNLLRETLSKTGMLLQ